jgi:hypothetical protein
LIALNQETHLKLRISQTLRILRIARNARDLATDISLHPEDYIAPAKKVGEALGGRTGEWLDEDFLRRPPRQMGQSFGTVVGRVQFEVASEILFAIGTEGAGNLMHAASAGHFARGGRLLGALIGDLKPAVQTTRGMQRLALSTRNEAELFSLMVETALDETAGFQTGPLRSIRIKNIPVNLNPQQLAQWRKLSAGKSIPSDFANLWKQCRNPLSDRNLTEIGRLVAKGDKVSMAEAHELGRQTFDRWRNRFMNKLRNPANSALRKQIEEVGFSIDLAAKTSPKLVSGDVLTLDHMTRIMDNPRLCVDPANLQFAIGYENSVTLEQLRNMTSATKF